MKKKYKILPVVLALIVMLTACKDTRKDDLFKQAPGEKTLSQANDTEEEPTPVPTEVAAEEPAPTEAVIAEVPPTEPVVPVEETLSPGKPDLNRENDTEKDDRPQPEDQDGGKASQANNYDNKAVNQESRQGNNADQNRQQEETMETLSDNIDKEFYYEKLSDGIKARINGKSYAKDCKVPYSDLRYVKVLHYGFDGEVHEGELIVNKAIAGDIVDIFKELYDIKYPIEKMVLVDEYNADDNASMADNNTSSFNYRVVEGTDRISLHGYGLAIDINPLYNPYIHTIKGEKVITPVNGAQYADRSLDCEYYIKKNDDLYNAFIERGFTWGGDWKNSKDYQHFQKEPE